MLDIAGTSEAILASVVAYYTDHAAEVLELPARRYIAAGDPRAVAWDCDDGQVTVAFAASTLQQHPDLAGPATVTPNRNRTTQLIRTGAFELQIVRPAPSPGYGGDPPTADTLSAHGLALQRDVAHVIAAVTAAVKGRDGVSGIVPEGHGPAPVLVPTVEVIGPTGNLAGIAVTITVQLL